MNRIYYAPDGIICHDPGPGMIPFFSALDENYRVESIRPGNGFIPRFQLLRQKRIATGKGLFESNEKELLDKIASTPAIGIEDANEIFAFDALYALSLREISNCRLCGHECGVDRYNGTGKCGITNETHNSSPFIHIAEEQVINPAIVTNFSGCSMRCLYCIDHRVWEPSVFLKTIPKAFWDDTRSHITTDIPIDSIEFTNTTESIHGVIGILSSAPEDFNLPVVMNTHLYGTKAFYDIAIPVTDVWLPDIRYGNDDCARKLSGVENYMHYSKLGLDAMREHNGRVIVRLLVLPGHVNCCMIPALELLSKYKESFWVSILDQYVPEHEAHLVPGLNRRPTREEISVVRDAVNVYGLRDISVDNLEFWNF